MSLHETFSEERTRAIVAEHSRLEGPLLPVLHAVQETFGYVPEAAVPLIAGELNLSRAEVYGVVTFYHDFRHAPAGKHVVKLCRAEACQAMGADALARVAERRLGLALGETSPDGRITLEPIFCLGLCATAPAGLVNGQPVGRLTPEGIETICNEVEA